MNISILRKVTIVFSVIAIVAMHYNVYGQENLVLNPSFEEIESCPEGPSQLYLAIDWNSANTDADSCSSPDLFATCNQLPFPLPWLTPPVGVPDNILGSQPALTGENYAGIIVHEAMALVGCDYVELGTFREYIQGRLSSPLVAGETYCVSFYVNLASDVKWGSDQMAMYLSPTEVQYNFCIEPHPLPLTPQLQYEGPPLLDTENWVQLSWDYIAEGGEQFFVIGNFSDNSNTPLYDVNCGSMNPYAYYYIEDVSIISGYCGDPPPPGEILATIDANPYNCGMPTTATISITQSCTGSPNVQWSTGDYGYTANIFQAGTYSVTVSDEGCSDLIINFEVEETAEFSVEIEIEPYDVCDDSVLLTAIVTGADPQDVLFEWNNNVNLTEQTLVVTSAGSYQVNARYGFCRMDHEVDITLYQTPEINEYQNVSACNSYTLPEIIGVNLTGEQAYYTEQGGNGNSYEAGNTLLYSDFNPEDFPLTLYVYDINVECWDEVSFELDLYEQPTIEIVDIFCNQDGTLYNIELAETSGQISSNAGTVDEFTIIDIPVGTDVTITIENPECIETVEIDSYNCDCEIIEVPVAENPDHQQVCHGLSNPELSVQTPEPSVDYQINWYSTVSGGTPLITNSETYTPIVTQIGVHSFYAEVEDVDSGCKSERIEVTLTILQNPTLTGPSLICEASETIELHVSGGSGTDHPTTAWTSENTSIATVSDGVVMAENLGNTVITYMDSNECIATRNISVTDNCDNLFSISGKAMYAGRVHPHPVNGTDYDDPIFPLDSVLIVLKDANNNEIDSYITTSNGLFEFTGLEPNTYYLEYSKIYNEMSSWVNSVNVTDYTWFKTYVLNHYDEYYDFLRFDDLYWNAMNVTCEQPPAWNVADYNQIKFKILNFMNYEVYEPFINNPNTFCYGSWQGGVDEVIITDADITDYNCLLLVYGDYNASATGYIYRETGTNVHSWDQQDKFDIDNFIVESDEIQIVNQNEFLVPLYIKYDMFDLLATQLTMLYPYDKFDLQSIVFNDYNSKKTVKSGINISFNDIVNSEYELLSVDHNGMINLIYTPHLLNHFSIISKAPSFYLHFASKNSSVDVERDFYLYGIENVLATADFNEIRNTEFTIPKLKNNPALIENQSFDDIKLYPNPTNDYINIDFRLNETKNIQVSVVDITGRVVLKMENKDYLAGSNQIVVPVSQLSKGYYSVRLLNTSTSDFVNLKFMVK